MKFSMTGQGKGDFLIQVASWEDLTVHEIICSIVRKYEINENLPSLFV